MMERNDLNQANYPDNADKTMRADGSRQGTYANNQWPAGQPTSAQSAYSQQPSVRPGSPQQGVPPYRQNSVGQPYRQPGQNMAAPNPGAYNGNPAGNFAQNRANGNYYYAPQNNMQGYNPYPQVPQKKRGTSPVVYVLIAVLSVCLLAVTVLCIYLFAGGENESPWGAFLQFGQSGESEYSEVQTVPTTTMPTFSTATEAPTTAAPVTEAPTTEPTTAKVDMIRECIYELNAVHANYFDFCPNEDGYILPHSSTRLISEYELQGMTEHEVCMARNEIYARYGYIFKTEKYNEYFKIFSWYRPMTSTLPELSEIESQNVKTISAYENKMGW